MSTLISFSLDHRNIFKLLVSEIRILELFIHFLNTLPSTINNNRKKYFEVSISIGDSKHRIASEAIFYNPLIGHSCEIEHGM